MNSKLLKATIVGAGALVSLLMAGCVTRTGSNRVDIFTETHYTQSYRPQEPPRLMPAEGAVPITGKDLALTAEEAKNLANPLPKTAEVLKNGAELYKVNCSMCHGADGKGDGPVGSYLEKWNYGKPSDLTVQSSQQKTDGDIFSITSFTVTGSSGISPMPEFSKLLTNDQIWAIVHQIRALQGK